MRWFAVIIKRRIRRGVFGSVSELPAAIRFWARHWNNDPKPFIWTKAADEFIEKSSEDGLLSIAPTRGSPRPQASAGTRP